MKESFAKTKSERIVWIDLCRGIGIILVLLGHTHPPFMKWIYSFHMPLFFILSGYLFKEEKLQIYIPKILKKYIVPYFILCGINLILQIIIQSSSGYGENAYKYIIGILYSRGSTAWMPNCSPLWFLTALFCGLLIYQIIAMIKNRWIYFLLIIGCSLVSYLLDIFNVPKLVWNIDTALMAVLFIEFGYQLNHKKLLERISEIKIPVIFLSTILLLYTGAMGVKYNLVDTISFDNNSYGSFLLMLIPAMFFSLLLIFLCYKSGELNSIIIGVLEKIGKHTIFLMGFDYFSNTLAILILSRILNANWITIFIVKSLILFVGFIIWRWFVNKLPNKKLKKILNF